MNNKKLFTIIAIILILAIVGAAVYYGLRGSTTTSDSSSMSGMDMSNSTNTDLLVDANSSTYKQYAALSGDAYDKAFLANMSAHHQGAIDMATLASNQASHPEIKTLAATIVTAQTSEMTNMMNWEVSWGYVAKGSDPVMDSSSMGTMNDMSSMTDELRGLTADAFDKKFLALMIQHHQSAINMSTPGLQNAKHQEVKDLTRAIVNAQSAEIKQMQAWQKAWGYTS
jgi:uncharacterized protein (DUF305 family)